MRQEEELDCLVLKDRQVRSRNAGDISFEDDLSRRSFECIDGWRKDVLFGTTLTDRYIQAEFLREHYLDPSHPFLYAITKEHNAWIICLHQASIWKILKSEADLAPVSSKIGLSATCIPRRICM